MPGQFLGTAPAQPGVMAQALQAIQPAVDIYTQHMLEEPQREFQMMEHERLQEQLALQQEQFAHQVELSEWERSMQEQLMGQERAEQFAQMIREVGPDQATELYHSMPEEERAVLREHRPELIVEDESGVEGIAHLPDWREFEPAPGLLMRQDVWDPDRQEVIDIRPQLEALDLPAEEEVIGSEFDPRTGHMHLTLQHTDPITGEITRDVEILEDVAPIQPDSVEMDYRISEDGTAQQVLRTVVGDDVTEEVLDTFEEGDPVPPEVLQMQQQMRMFDLEEQQAVNQLVRDGYELDAIEERLDLQLERGRLDLELTEAQLEQMERAQEREDQMLGFEFTGDPNDPIRMAIQDKDTGEVVQHLDYIPAELMGAYGSIMGVLHQQAQMEAAETWAPEEIALEATQVLTDDFGRVSDDPNRWWTQISGLSLMAGRKQDVDPGLFLEAVIEDLEETALRPHPEIVRDLRHMLKGRELVKEPTEINPGDVEQIGPLGVITSIADEILDANLGFRIEDVDEKVLGIERVPSALDTYEAAWDWIQRRDPSKVLEYMPDLRQYIEGELPEGEETIEPYPIPEREDIRKRRWGPFEVDPQEGEELGMERRDQTLLERVAQFLTPREAEAIERGQMGTLGAPGAPQVPTAGAPAHATDPMTELARAMAQPATPERRPQVFTADPTRGMERGMVPATRTPQETVLAEALRGQFGADPQARIGEGLPAGERPTVPRPTHAIPTPEEEEQLLATGRELFDRMTGTLVDVPREEHPEQWYPQVYRLGQELGLNPSEVERALKRFTSQMGDDWTRALFGRELDEVWQLLEQYYPER